MDRRSVLRAGGLAVAGLAGCLGGDGGGGSTTTEGYGDWFEDVDNFDGTVERTGEDEVTVKVGTKANGGAFGFGPAAVEVSTGTTVVWEWTGDGSSHNVIAEDGSFSSALAVEAGYTFEQTFAEPALHRYYCKPHRSLGMKGAVRVVE